MKKQNLQPPLTLSIWLLATFLGIVHSIFVKFIYERVPNPYMDEEFHVNQTREYCAGNWRIWNPKITTPPALYILAVPFLCGVERYLNSILIPICFVFLWKLRRKWQPFESPFLTLLTVFCLITMPVLLDTSFLFYTDLLSLTTILVGFTLENPTISSVFFTIGVFTRQTNIIWGGGYCLLNWLKNVDKSKPISSTFKLILKHSGFVVLAIAFLMFLYSNGGSIVLGDKTAHQLVLHIPQFLYFLLFSTCFSWPIFLSRFFQSPTISSQIKNCKILALVFLFISLISINYLTYGHPYLLADNRHFTFYIWRRFFARHFLCKFLLSPFYVLSFFFVFNSISMSKEFKFVYFLGTCATIIPAHLLEFRYFIIPYILWRLSVFEKRRFCLYLEILTNICLNLIALYLFLEKPFKWPNKQNEWQRFMW